MAREMQQDIESLRGDIAKFREDASALAEAVRDIAVETGSNGYDRLKRTTARTGRMVEKQIEKRPFTSVMATFVAGVTLGFLLPRGNWR